MFENKSRQEMLENARETNQSGQLADINSGYAMYGRMKFGAENDDCKGYYNVAKFNQTGLEILRDMAVIEKRYYESQTPDLIKQGHKRVAAAVISGFAIFGFGAFGRYADETMTHKFNGTVMEEKDRISGYGGAACLLLSGVFVGAARRKYNQVADAVVKVAIADGNVRLIDGEFEKRDTAAQIAKLTGLALHK